MFEPQATLLSWEASTTFTGSPFVISIAFEVSENYHTAVYMRGSFVEWMIQQEPERQAEVKTHFLKVLGQHFDHALSITSAKRSD